MRNSSQAPSSVNNDPGQFISTSSNDGPSVTYLNNLFTEASREGISDIHFEDTDQGTTIRQRVSGELQIIATLDATMGRDFDSKIRMKSKLPLIERQIPLDGKFRFEVDGRFIDVRVSIFQLGDNKCSIVCRLLDQRKNLQKLEDIKMPESVRAALLHIIAQPQGLLLITGPTGSGKTTTLYGLLQHLNTPQIKICTIEDPVEYEVPGIVQAQTNSKLTFGLALRAMLRQDPDVILVGEIRDSETAKIAVQSALTGHIVLSTLHTNTAALSLNRLLDLDVDSNTLSGSVGGVMAQRLVRWLCDRCKIKVPVDAYVIGHIKRSNVRPELIEKLTHTYSVNPDGCDCCRKGWTGRLPVFELIMPSPEVRLAIEEKNLKALVIAAENQPQYTSLTQAALYLVIEGLTTLQEAIAVTGSEQITLEI